MNPVLSQAQAEESDSRPVPSNPYLSIVVPVHNEAQNLDELMKDLTNVLRQINLSHEIIFVDDGSRDTSLQVLLNLKRQHPNITVVQFTRNFGQHPAIFAGLERARGQVIVTLDADLQNPPAAIPLLLAKINEGYDVVGGWREERQDPFPRRFASRIINQVISWATGVQLKDYGCMLRAYRQDIVTKIRESAEISSFIPALANTYAHSVAEVKVPHNPRKNGSSKYNGWKLLQLNFDLITGFSLLPIQFISFIGASVTAVGLISGIIILVNHVLGKTHPMIHYGFKFSILCFLNGIEILALGLIGEYVGRIYNEVRRRPRYIVKQIY